MNYEHDQPESDEKQLQRPLSPATRAHLQSFAGKLPGMIEFLAESDALEPTTEPFTPDTK